MSEATEDRRGHCYDLAAEYVLEHADEPRLYLCHGWPVLQGDSEHAGSRYGHAWVERSKMLRLPFGEGVHVVELVECWDTVSGDWLPKVVFYLGGRIESDHVTRYSFSEAREMLLAAKDYGPWVDSPYENVAPFRGETQTPPLNH
jgi:hypothetical protein